MRWIALALLVAPAFAQSPISAADAEERRIIEERLNSDAAADLAWAAHLAANYRQPIFVPRIIELLNHSDRDVRLVALDSLIRLRARVAWEFLEPLVPQHFDAIVILGAIDLRENEVHLNALLDEKLSDIRWAALNGRLLSGRPPDGYAGRLLREWHPRFVIDVGIKLPPKGGYGLCGDGRPMPRSGFPSVVHYEFQQEMLGAIFTGKPHPVYYAAVDGAIGCFFPISRDEYTLDYLRELTGLTEAELPRPQPLLIKWTNAAAYRQALLAYREQIRTFVTKVRDALVTRGTITADEVVEMPMLDVVIQDQRPNKSAPLPAIDWTL